jgi:hypothetical protein
MDDEVLLLLSSELRHRMPGWHFRYGREPDARRDHTVLIVQFSRHQMFERFGSIRSWEEPFLLDPKDSPKHAVDKIIAKLSFMLAAREHEAAYGT